MSRSLTHWVGWTSDQAGFRPASAANEARFFVVRQIIDEFGRDEYERRLQHERERRGLPPIASGEISALRKRVRELEAENQRLREQPK